MRRRSWAITLLGFGIIACSDRKEYATREQCLLDNANNPAVCQVIEQPVARGDGHLPWWFWYWMGSSNSRQNNNTFYALQPHPYYNPYHSYSGATGSAGTTESMAHSSTPNSSVSRGIFGGTAHSFSGGGE